MKTLKDIKDWKEIINEIMFDECFSSMAKLPDSIIDCIVTDPPYGMDYQSSRRADRFDKIALDMDIEWFPNLAKEMYRLLKDNTHAYIFCNDYAISHFRQELENVGFTIKRTLVWLKNNHTSGDLEGDYGNKTEFILFAHKGRKELNGNRDTNVLIYPRVSDMAHPTQKPVELIQYLISKSSQKEDLILDPFMGSWTTARACKDLGRNFVGFEISEKYCKIGEERLRQEVLF